MAPPGEARRSTLAVGLSIVGGLGLSFVLSVALARWLGVAEFGTYVYVMSWVGVLGALGTIGLETTLVRQLPAYAADSAWSLARRLVGRANGVTLLASLGLVGLALLGWALIAGPAPSPPSAGWILVGLLVPIAALLRLQQSALRGLQHPGIGQLPQAILAPCVVLALVGAWGWAGTIAATAEQALLAQAVGTGVALVVAIGLVRRIMPAGSDRSRPVAGPRPWLAISGRMMLLSTLTLLNGRIGILILGAIAAPQVVAHYTAALRGSGFVPLALNVAVLTLAPVVAGAHAVGDRARVQRVAGQMSRLALLGGLPVAAGMLLFGRGFLGLFGPDFEGASPALVILVVGELVNVAAGPVATLLVMTGHERDATVGLVVATALNAALTLVLVPGWGVTGASAAAAASVVVWNVILWQSVRHRLGFTPSIRGARIRSIPPSPPT